MRLTNVGDLGFFYHSLSEKAVVGVVEVCKESHPDSTTDDERWECVDIKAVKPLATAVTLEDVKGEPRLAEMVLVNNTRLSVQPVRDDEWALICNMGGIEA